MFKKAPLFGNGRGIGAGNVQKSPTARQWPGHGSRKYSKKPHCLAEVGAWKQEMFKKAPLLGRDRGTEIEKFNIGPTAGEQSFLFYE